MENKRRDFLKTACAPVVFSMFGISMLEACSSGDDDGYSAAPVSNGGGMNSGTSQDTAVTIDLDNSNFSQLASVGGWMNYMDENMLLLRISDTQIRAFSNICPHAGANNQWSHQNSILFVPITTGLLMMIVLVPGLTCYNTMIEGTTLTVNR